MVRCSPAYHRRPATSLAALLIGLLVAACPRVRTSAEPETVLLGNLGFVDKLTNPCQVVREGSLLSPGGGRRLSRTSELMVEITLAQVVLRSARLASGMSECAGLRLDGQPPVSSIAGKPRRQALVDMFGAFLNQTAHLYLMAQEIEDSHHTCGNESITLVDHVSSLAGRLQSILCVISENVPARLLQPKLEAITGLPLQTYRGCPRRLMRNCLVLNNTSNILLMCEEYLSRPEPPQNNFLQPRLIRRRPLLRFG